MLKKSTAGNGLAIPAATGREGSGRASFGKSADAGEPQTVRQG
jgi:hypothetical protein